MRLLIISQDVYRSQLLGDSRYTSPQNIQLVTADMNAVGEFTDSVFDYDVSIIHIDEPRYHTEGYCRNLPKLLQDCIIALENGRSIICLPEAPNFISRGDQRKGMSAYEWLEKLGITLQDNYGEAIKPSGAGRALAIQEYLQHVSEYHQIVAYAPSSFNSTLAVVEDTGIIVGIECEIGRGNLVVLPPPRLHGEYYCPSMEKLIEVARRYYDRAQRRIPIGDTPDWLAGFLTDDARRLEDEINRLAQEKAHYDEIAYVLYGTGDNLETSVALLLEQLGLQVERQPTGANIDLKAKHVDLGLGFAVEVTGTRDIVKKDSNKIAQAWQYLSERVGTAEENHRLMIIANTQYHLDPDDREMQSYSDDVVKLLGNNGVLLLNTLQLYEQWKAAREGIKAAEEIVEDLHIKYGLSP